MTGADQLATDSIPTDVVSLLRLMVGTPSVNRPGVTKADYWPERALGERLEKLAGLWGLETRWMPVPGRGKNLLVILPARGSGAGLPWLLFDSHLDTVSDAGMVVDAFGGEVVEGRMYGRGTSDTKGTGAAMLWAIKMLAEEGGVEGRHVGLLLGVDEEVTMRGVRHFVSEGLSTLGGPVEGVIVGEPTGLYPLVAHHGAARWVLETEGEAAHSSLPELGANAVSLMCRLVVAIERDYRPLLEGVHPLAGPPACSVTVIQGGDQPNIIPAGCMARVDRRLAWGTDIETAEQSLRAVLAAEVERVRSSDVAGVAMKWKLEPEGYFPGLDDRQGVAFGAGVRGVLEHLGLESRAVGAPFCTHAGWYSRLGIPAVVIGPGEYAAAHREDESIALDQLQQGVRVYRELAMMRIGG